MQAACPAPLRRGRSLCQALRCCAGRSRIGEVHSAAPRSAEALPTACRGERLPPYRSSTKESSTDSYPTLSFCAHSSLPDVAHCHSSCTVSAPKPSRLLCPMLSTSPASEVLSECLWQTKSIRPTMLDFVGRGTHREHPWSGSLLSLSLFLGRNS